MLINNSAARLWGRYRGSLGQIAQTGMLFETTAIAARVEQHFAIYNDFTALSITQTGIRNALGVINLMDDQDDDNGMVLNTTFIS